MEQDIILFKEKLKEICAELKAMIDNKVANYNEIIDGLKESKGKNDIIIDLGMQSSTVTSQKMQEIKEQYGVLLTKEDEEKIAEVNDAFMDFRKAQCYQALYDDIRAAIAAFDVDKVKAVIDLRSMFLFCYLISNHSSFDGKALNRCFGMVVSFNAAAIDGKNPELTDIDRLTLTLGEYYNTDGTFKRNEDRKKYTDALDAIRKMLRNDESEFVWSDDFWDIKVIPFFENLLYISNAAYEREALKTDDVCTIIRCGLRKCRKEVESLVDEYAEQKYAVDNNFTDDDIEYLKNIGFANTVRQNPGYRWFMVKNLKKKPNVSKIHFNMEAAQNELSFRKEVEAISQMINSFDGKRAKNPVSIYYLVIMCEQMHLYQEMPFDILCKAFGMAVYTTALKGPENQYTSFVKALAPYFNEDGTFVKDKSAMELLNILKDLINAINAENGLITGESGISLDLAEAFFALHFAQTIVDNVMDDMVIIEDDKPQKFAPTVVDRKAVRELRKYYNNGEIIAVPEDMDAFMDTLDKCLLDEKEKTYILKLVYAKIKAETVEEVDPAETYLVDDELSVYLVAKELHTALPRTDNDYFYVNDALTTLKSACELLPFETEEESIAYLQEEKDESLEVLRKFVSKHIKTERVTSNNLIFLGSYFANDLESLDKAKQKRVLNVLPRLIKDNQSNFKRIVTGENLDFIPYEFVSGGIRIPFVEIDSGIYLILGCDIVGEGYRKSINRALKESSNIAILESQIKDSTRRMDLLIEGEESLKAITQAAGGRR